MFGRLLESHNETADSQLVELERQLKNKIDRAKNLAQTLQTSSDNDDLSFTTTASGELVFPEFKSDVNYNDEFWKTYLRNQLSFAMIKELSERTTQLQSLVREIQNLQQDYFRLFKLKNRKKNRRLAVEIEKKFECPYEKCYKFYGSDVSLNLHIKLKHHGGNKTDREKLAEQICLAQINKTPFPEMRLNLPPGYLEEYKKNHFSQRQKIEGEQLSAQQE